MYRRSVLQHLVSAFTLVLLPLSAAQAKGPKNKDKPAKNKRMPPGHARKEKYRVAVAPPKPVAEPRPEAPSPRHVWVPGYWSWSNERHIWVSGMWSMPPQQNVVWVQPQWVNESGSWLFFEGQWSLSIR